MNKTLSVSAIQNGTVIDHITPGQTLRIIHMLRLLHKKLKVTVGFNLSSNRLRACAENPAIQPRAILKSNPETF